MSEDKHRAQRTDERMNGTHQNVGSSPELERSRKETGKVMKEKS